jgi:predicted nuclease of predicted toxin-antitoxin system
LGYAVSAGAVIIAKDEDLALRRTHADAGPAIVWLRRGNTSQRDLLAWFEPLLPTVIELLSRGEPLVEIA